MTALGGAPVEVRVAGRDIELTGSTSGDPALAQAVAVAAQVDGVRRVSTRSAAGQVVAAGSAGSTPGASASTGQPIIPTAPPSSPSTTGSSSDAFPVVRIVYSSGTYSLNRTGMLELNRVAIYLKAHPGTAVIIQGHSDSLGSAAVRERISLRRAQVARDYVVSRGITRERTSVQALSDSRPIAPNTTAAGRLSNRRVTIDLEDPR
jgi:outer membrane protein OmpA-like peptidoglycan-associated protein